MKILLEPFEGAATIIIPMPPIGAALYAVHHGRCTHFQISPEGYVPFVVFVEREDRDNDALTAWCMEHRGELVSAAMKLAATPVLLN